MHSRSHTYASMYTLTHNPKEFNFRQINNIRQIEFLPLPSVDLVK